MLTMNKKTIRVSKGTFYVRIRVQGVWDPKHPLIRKQLISLDTSIVGQHQMKTLRSQWIYHKHVNFGNNFGFLQHNF